MQKIYSQVEMSRSKLQHQVSSAWESACQLEHQCPKLGSCKSPMHCNGHDYGNLDCDINVPSLNHFQLQSPVDAVYFVISLTDTFHYHFHFHFLIYFHFNSDCDTFTVIVHFHFHSSVDPSAWCPVIVLLYHTPGHFSFH